MKSIWIAPVALMLTAAGHPPAEPAAADGLPGWMAGKWVQERGEDWVAESWTAPRGGAMLGNSLTGKGGKAVFFEFLRLQADKDGVLTYWASPGGQGPTPFRLVSADRTSIMFANPGHDYPQRIVYRRTGATMIAEISLIDGSKPERFTYRLEKTAQ